MVSPLRGSCARRGRTTSGSMRSARVSGSRAMARRRGRSGPGSARRKWPASDCPTDMPQAHRVSHRSILVAALSTVVEWYDFTLYLYFATVLSRVFFGGGDAALLTTLAGFAVASLMRPVGAAVFGH